MIEAKPKSLEEILSTDNVASLYDNDDLQAISAYIKQGYEADLNTTRPYERRVKKAVKIARMDSGGKDKTFPFVKASNIFMPYLQGACLEFNSRTMPEFQKLKLTKAEVIGRDKNKQKKARGERVKTCIDYVLNHELDGDHGEWRSDTDRATMYWPIAGMFFRKNWHCPETDKQKSALIFGTELIYDHSADSFYKAPRHSYTVNYSRNETYTKMKTGEWIYIELPEDEQYSSGSDDGRYDGSTPPKSNVGYDFIESHCLLDLDHDGYQEPYIVTFREETGEIVCIVKRFDKDDVEYAEDLDDAVNNEETRSGDVIKICAEEFFTQYGMIPDTSPEAKAVFVGYGVLLLDALEALNTLHNQLIDAGTLQNTSANSGFIDSSGVVKKGKVEMIMGQFTKIQTGTTSRPLRDSIVNFPFAGPSQALLQLLEMLKGDLQNMVRASAELDVNAGEAASLYLARLQQALKQPNMLSTRLFKAFGHEIKRISYLIHRYSDNAWYNDVLDGEELTEQPNEPDQARVEPMQDEQDEEGNRFYIELDFDDEKIAISPAADPRMGSEMERIQKAEIVLQEAKTQPMPVLNLREAYIDFLQAIDVQDVERLAPDPSLQQESESQQAQQMFQLQQQYAQADMQRQTVEAQARMLSAQASMMRAQGDAQKVQAEIEKLYSEIAKNMSEIETDQAKTAQAGIQQQIETIRGLIDDQSRQLERQDNAASRRIVALRPGNAGAGNGAAQ